MNDFTTALTRDQAYDILATYNKEPFHLRHGQVVEGIMRYFARELGYPQQEDFWGIVGLLHDIDYEMYPEEHCVKAVDLLREHRVEERLIQAVVSHGYGICADVAPEHPMEKVLYAVDELSGLIGANALVRPSKSVSDMKVKSVRKKFRDKSFAAAINRETIEKGAEMLGWELDYLIEQTLLAMKEDPEN